jgi:hypothetical protein
MWELGGVGVGPVYGHVETLGARAGQYAHPFKVPNGYCPNHSTGVTLPADFQATPLQYVDGRRTASQEPAGIDRRALRCRQEGET